MELPGHRIDTLIREVPGSRLVVRSFARGRNCVTRVLLSDRVDPRLSTEIERIVLTGEGFAPLPRSLDLTLAGYRVAARLPRDPAMPWTSAVAAGVNPEGYLYVSTRWIEGTPLHHLLGQLSERMRRQLVQDVARILVELHSRSIAYGDFKADNLVMTPSGQVALIDLDTLRLVPGPTMPAVTQDVTRSWAAPEQFQQKTYLSSDLFAFGRLLGELFPDDMPLEWQELVTACRLPDPLQRPQTALVYQRLRGQRVQLRDWNDRPTPPAVPLTATVTERVMEDELPPQPPDVETVLDLPPEPDPLVTGPVAAPTWNEPSEQAASPKIPVSIDLPGPTVDPAPPRPQPRKSGLMSCLQYLLGFLGISLFFCAGGGYWYYTTEVESANLEAEATLSAIKIYKTNPDVNRDSSQRKLLRERAEKAYGMAHTPRTSAVRALALVWSQGWQDTSKSWNAADFENGQAALDDVVGGNQPEALLAAGTLYSGACRLSSRSDTADRCLTSLEAISSFFLQVPESPEYNWMRVEAWWVKEMVLSKQYFRATQAKSGDAGSILAQARQVCADVLPYLNDAPVNGTELLEDCLVLDGSAGDVEGWLSTAFLLTSRSDDASTQKHLFLAAGPGCEDLSFKRGSKVEPSSKADPWCVAMGWAGQKQWATAAAIARNHPEDGRPWQPLLDRLQREVPQAFVVPRPYWDLSPYGE